MSNSLKIKLTAAAVLAAVLMLCSPQPARADLEIALAFDANAKVVVGTAASFTAVSFTGTFGTGGIGGPEFTVSIFGGSSDNGASLSDLLSSTTSVTNNSGATHTLHLYVTQTDYSLPVGTPLMVESGLGGSVNTPTLTLTNIFQAYASNANTIFDTTDFSNGPQTATPSGTTFDTGSATNNFNRTTAVSLYSLTSVANFELTAGGKANYSDHVNVRAVPEPASMILLGTGLVGLVVSFRLRQRKS